MQDKKFLDISIIIVTWNGLGLLKESLDSVVEAVKNYPGRAEILLVDNGSVDRTVDVITDFYPTVNILKLDKNYGFSIGNNKGVEVAKYDHICFLNNDVKIGKDFLEKIAEPFLENPSIFSVSPVTFYWDKDPEEKRVFSSVIGGDIFRGELIQYWAVKNGQSLLQDKIYPTLYGTGAALLVNKEKFQQLGGFNEIFSPAYWEDTDLCYHAWKRNWPSYFTPFVGVWHKISASSSSLDNSFKRGLIVRNAIVFYWINVNELIPLLKSFIRTCFYMVDRHRHRDPVWFSIWSLLRRDVPSILKIKFARFRTNVNSDRRVLKMTSLPGKDNWMAPRIFELSTSKKRIILYAINQIKRRLLNGPTV